MPTKRKTYIYRVICANIKPLLFTLAKLPPLASEGIQQVEIIMWEERARPAEYDRGFSTARRLVCRSPRNLHRLHKMRESCEVAVVQ